MSEHTKAVEDTAISVVQAVGSTAQLVLRFGNAALPVLEAVVTIGAFLGASAIPGVGPAIAIIGQALPILSKIAAGAPIVAEAMDKNRNVMDALIESAPSIVGYLKQLYAVAANADPLHLGITPQEVTTEMLVGFCGILKQSQFTPQDRRFDMSDLMNR